MNPYQYIHSHPHQTENLNSLGNTFQVDYIPNASTSSINPHFPVIHFATEGKHNGWVHIVHTDMKEKKWQKFVDAMPGAEAFPFYTEDQEFYDAPLYAHSLFRRPVTVWKGHAYAVEVDHKSKTIKCLGGVEWGFKLPFFKFHPVCLTPRALQPEEWNQDWAFLHESLPGYKLSSDQQPTA
jgi:hypothetical protein